MGFTMGWGLSVLGQGVAELSWRFWESWEPAGRCGGAVSLSQSETKGTEGFGGKGETEAQEGHPWLSAEGLGLVGAGWRITFLFNGIVCTGRRLLI